MSSVVVCAHDQQSTFESVSELDLRVMNEEAKNEKHTFIEVEVLERLMI